tara:strand:- start:295 stop:585 length:291 start_codon:yes stop_codon:yes gene_type:complete
MSKSTEQELSTLHGVVAQVLTAQISETIEMTDEVGKQVTVHTATPATIAAAIKFLKDNDITASVADDDNLGALDEMLKKKRTKRQLKLASVTEISA